MREVKAKQVTDVISRHKTKDCRERERDMYLSPFWEF